jgi:hypothetical protein
VVPADHKWFARLVIGSAIVSALEELNLRFPRVGKDAAEKFTKVRKALVNEGKPGKKRAKKLAKKTARKLVKRRARPKKAA